jgi:nicotinamide-nucleotide amidase
MSATNSVTDAALRRLAARVAKRLRAAGETLVTAESCTGGFIAKVLTDLPGSSDWFERGWVAYSNAA